MLGPTRGDWVWAGPQHWLFFCFCFFLFFFKCPSSCSFASLGDHGPQDFVVGADVKVQTLPCRGRRFPALQARTATKLFLEGLERTPPLKKINCVGFSIQTVTGEIPGEETAHDI